MNRRSNLAWSDGAAGPLLGPELPPDWTLLAECQYVPPDLFFVEKGGSVRPAKRICASCPVRTPCLEYALENEEMHGVWGGLSPEERLNLRPAPVSRTRRPGYCGNDLHVMDEANTGTDGRCQTCKRASQARAREARRQGKGLAA